MDLAGVSAGVPAPVLVVNVGSSSTKVSLLDDRDQLVSSWSLPPPGEASGARRLAEVARGAGVLLGVGHRVVHGGAVFADPVRVTDAVLAELHGLSELAPLHQPAALGALEVVRRARPEVPSVACFDTAFHAGLPAEAATYALPRSWRDAFELRRYGFHGLSHAYGARRAGELDGRGSGRLRLVTCHLGAGASLAAVSGGRSVDTTMGFTPLEGLVMATRSGSIDPGLVVFLEEHLDLAPAALADALEHASGLAGLAGTGDMAAVLAAEADGAPEAALAVGVYLHRLRAGIAAMATAMAGLDALVFTGGVGEASAEIRRRSVEGLAFLGVALDRDANEQGSGDREITAPGAAVGAFVVRAREDLEIAAGVRQVLPAGAPPAPSEEPGRRRSGPART